MSASATQGGHKKKKKERNYKMKIYMVSLLHRATIISRKRGFDWYQNR